MSNSVLIWMALVWLVLVFVVYRWYTRHPTAEDAIRGKIEVQQTDAAALADLLKAAGVPAKRVRAVDDLLNEDSICWSSGRWGWVDRILLVPKLFGSTGENCVGIKDGRVVSLSLVNHELEDLSALAGLDALKTVQLAEGQIASLAGVPGNCGWWWLNLESNELVDADLLHQCTNLRVLNVSFNKIPQLSRLDSLEHLQRLRAANNKINRVDGLAGHPSLIHVDLGHNSLSSAASFNNLENLGTLDLSNNKIESLAGMGDLPKLLVLRAGSNPITEIEVEILEQLPLLQNVSFANTGITRLPEDYAFTADRPSGSEIAKTDTTETDTTETDTTETDTTETDKAKTSGPKIDVSHTALLEVLRASYVATFDADIITYVEKLPRGRGFVKGTSRRGSLKTGLSSEVNYEGQIATFRGTHTIGFEVDRAIGITFRAALEEGMVRVYLQDLEGRYFYKETIPGRPVEISGRLITGTSKYVVFLESVDGTAKGIKWSCE